MLILTFDLLTIWYILLHIDLHVFVQNVVNDKIVYAIVFHEMSMDMMHGHLSPDSSDSTYDM